MVEVNSQSWGQSQGYDSETEAEADIMNEDEAKGGWKKRRGAEAKTKPDVFNVSKSNPRTEPNKCYVIRLS